VSVVELRVTPEAAGERLDAYLAASPELALSRSAIKRLLGEGRVELSAGDARPARRLAGGERIRVLLPEAGSLLPRPQPLPLSLVYEDDHLAVVDKPAGLVVHPAPGHQDGTLVNALLHALGDLPPTDDPTRPGIVHRLDRYTSGLLVVARTPDALVSLQRQIRERAATRVYRLLASHGRSLPTSGTFDTPYGRHPKDRKRFSSRFDARRRAVTHFRVTALHETLAECEARLETGRTHQIRVHFSDAGHPLCGDRVYGGRVARTAKPVERRALAGLERQFLHATRLELTHPATHAQLRFDSPLPADLAAIVDLLAAGRG